MRSLEGCRGEVSVSGIDDKPHLFTIQGHGRKLEDILKDKSLICHSILVACRRFAVEN